MFPKVWPGAFQNIIINKWVNQVIAIYVQMYVEVALLAELKPEEYAPEVYNEAADHRRVGKYRSRMYVSGTA